MFYVFFLEVISFYLSYLHLVDLTPYLPKVRFGYRMPCMNLATSSINISSNYLILHSIDNASYGRLPQDTGKEELYHYMNSKLRSLIPRNWTYLKGSRNFFLCEQSTKRGGRGVRGCPLRKNKLFFKNVYFYSL